MHRSDVEGHSRVPVTYMRLKQLFARKGMEYVVDILSNLVKLVSKQNLMGPNCLVFFSLYWRVPDHPFPFPHCWCDQSNSYNVHKLHGLPSTIVYDRDPIFASYLWTKLFKLPDVH